MKYDVWSGRRGQVRLVALVSVLLVVLAAFAVRFWLPGGRRAGAPIEFNGKNHPGELTSSAGLRLLLIPAGEFDMGSPHTEVGHRDPREQLAHLRIETPFYLSECEVTQSQYESVMGENPSLHRGANRPVERVTWEEALAYCRKLSEREGATYRLPTAAEWEYSCRSGTSTPFSFGQTISSDQVNFAPSEGAYQGSRGTDRGETLDVGSLPANAFGLRDMHGNVAEWCLDLYPGPVDYHSVAGGGFDSSASACRSAGRIGMVSMKKSSLGFRVVRTVEPESQYEFWPEEAGTAATRLKSRIDKSFATPAAELKPGVFIFPVFHTRSEKTAATHGAAPPTTGLGSYGWGRVAALLAVYGKERRIAVNPSLLDQICRQYGFASQGQKLGPDTVERCLEFTGLKLYALPKLEDGRTLVVEIHGDGNQYQDRTFRHEISRQEQPSIPFLIARDVLEYFGIEAAADDPLNLNPAAQFEPTILYDFEQALADAPEVRTEDWWAKQQREFSGRSVPDPDAALKKVARPDMFFLPVWDAWLRHGYDRAEAFRTYEASVRRFSCDWLRLAEARYLRETGRFRESLELLLSLVPTHRGDSAVYEELSLLALRLGETEIVEHVLTLWQNECTTAAGQAARAAFLVQWAWYSRGSQYASSVPREEWERFSNRLTDAKEALEAAAEMAPREPSIRTELITVAKGLGLPETYVNQQFDAAIRADPKNAAVYTARFGYLMPRWHGKPDELLSFAVRCAQSGLWDEGIPQLFLDAVRDLALDPKQASYRREEFSRPQVWEGLQAYYAAGRKAVASRGASPENDRICSHYLLWGSFAGRHEEVAPALEVITHPALEVISDYILFDFLRDGINARVAPGAEQIVAKARLSLAAGDTESASRLLSDLDREGVPDAVKDDFERLQRARKAASDFRTSGSIRFAAGDLESTWLRRGDGIWSVEGEELVCRIPRFSHASLCCPFGFEHAEVNGTIRLSRKARMANLVLHARADMDSVHVRFEPHDHTLALVRNTLVKAQGALGGEKHAFRVIIDGAEDRVELNPGATWTLATPDFRTGSIGFEVYSMNNDCELRIGPVEIRAKK